MPEAAANRDAEILAVDEALKVLAGIDPRKSQVIELRFFGGLTAGESASILDMEVRDVRRELRLAEAWLKRELVRRAGQ